mmetsp:Transcript_26370/g.56056  ORF Transcript_26370/g.56056 Transcript_26370/m.56056 type:complete len:462 (+) Transcript_26370:141-1526(+)|eukprot:CAMPEP_0172555832 /NCGR_PEP_ID=MMETSP1067-20121228/60566_1 /TAXON_ID=265564 ORGANISM="Thalassiosira punctigera, Strain Tpunct2005C2" /NCGR_SAMPLE_ID=MMETSP1067 /ASSEMBLY_ACC=CAM_ASM_000444 /LENGTH=461 /DNA_ID=CAMNT_0013344443 /DNA_START=95 /DNA_END=1480 /DNA_ORIENTATION=+
MCNPSQHPADIELGENSSHPPSADELPTEPLIKGPPSSSASSSSISSSPSKTRRRNDHDPPNKTNADAGVGSAVLDALPPTQQMILLSFLMFLFFGMHNILQEAIVNLLNNSETLNAEDGTGTKANRTFMLGYAEVIGVLVFSYLERVHLTNEGGLARVAPLRAYPLLTACLFASSSLSNLSLSYINFPTKVVFRSCKLVPTMIIATIVNQRVFKSHEYVCALSICAGLVLFAVADYSLDPLLLDPTGLLLVSGSVVADAILPNAQEHLFKDGSSRLEVTVYSNLFSFLCMTVVTLANGSLVRFMGALSRDSTLALYFGVYSALSYISISCYMTLVKRFGGVTAVVLTTARKAMTLVLSFLLFPKGFSWMYVFGSLLVLGAVMVAGVCKKLAGKGSTSSKQVSTEEYSLEYRNNNGASGGEDAVESTSAQCGGERTTIPGDSHLECSAKAILEGISKRAYM